MKEKHIICRYQFFVDKPVETWSTILELLLPILIIVIGVALNYKFLSKLKEERRRRPVGRKGNVIEPLMRWFCIVQIIFWPLDLLFYWMATNEIIPAEDMPSWLLYLCYEPMRFGRSYLAYNSIFVAIIRYGYIIKHQKLNQWEFEKVGRLFQVASIAIPFVMETIGTFTFTGDFCKLKYQLENPEKLLSNEVLSQKETVEWTLNYFPESLVYTIGYIYATIKILVVSNIIEAFLYLKIFQYMER
jgi:hypothetical protein